MNRQKIAIVAATLALSACASSQHVLNKQPGEIIRSGRPPVDVALCIALKTESTSMEGPQGSRIIVARTPLGVIRATYTVFPDGAGSRIEYRNSYGANHGPLKKCI